MSIHYSFRLKQTEGLFTAIRCLLCQIKASTSLERIGAKRYELYACIYILSLTIPTEMNK